jgi:hypothetical protein
MHAQPDDNRQHGGESVDVEEHSLSDPTGRDEIDWDGGQPNDKVKPPCTSRHGQFIDSRPVQQEEPALDIMCR